ncbi:hypothetical protein FZEAL_4211 [Fusarium zealandicum]|uniref:very-long-chain (3R)-3-hydroxyacyl-CoA dehydratase n=1 Tax=Fusarium zealandicum TaxID=1053134 RepID=A0A8H4UM65_9HYPO|nr:hypothetical protein FZEAL_4211 [Fusarium zealandicum]
MSTSTAIELGSMPAARSQQAISSDDNTNDQDADPILQASRINDSAVPDGGQGWVIIAGCTTVSFWMGGTSYSWGVIQGALIEQGVSTPAVLSFVGSLSAALVSGMAIVNSRMMRVLGAQKTGMAGIFLLGLSALVSSFTFANVGALFATSGVVCGLGLSLCFTTISVAPAQYFSRKRGLANGIVFAGGGVGGAVVTYSLDVLIHRLGTGWAFRVFAITTLITGMPGAYLVKERVPYRSTGFVDWSLFRSFTFFIIFLVGAIGTFPLLVPPFFIPLYSKSIGLSSSAGAGLLAGFNLASAVGRICCGLLCDRLGALNVLFLSFVLTGISMLAIWPISTSLGPMIVFVTLNGMSNGAFFSTMPTVVGNVFGSARVSVAMSMVVTGWVGGYLMGSPIAGYILEAYGGAEQGLKAYRPAMFYAVLTTSPPERYTKPSVNPTLKMATDAAAKPKKPASALNTGYLILYNFVSAVAWSVVLGRTVALFTLRGPGFVYLGVGEWTRWTQTVAGMEVLHSLLGVVRAPFLTTAMQVASRFLLVWAIVDVFPFLAQSPFYSSMLVAWSTTEIIRYSFFALSLSGLQPKALTWLRYNTFFVLYPVGIFSECTLIWLATGPAGEINELYKWALYAILAIYVPGSYILYSHMMNQRRKVMRNLKAQSGKAQ